MSNNSEKPISLAEFARLVGCDESTVRRYVKEGRICGPAVAYLPTGKIAGLRFDLAKPQYLEARALVEFRFARSGGAPTGKTARKVPEPGQPTPAPAGASTPPPTGKAGKVGNLSEAELSELDLNQLAKRELVLRIQARQIEIAKERSSLVNIADVEAALTGFVPVIRKRMESISARLIDKLEAASSRHEALQLLTVEVNNALTELSDMFY